eukprot:3639201-Alexandrium_andersonii.AAC.1
MVTPSAQTSSRVMFAASTSRRGRQRPATISSLGPVGPARTHGSKPSGSSSARASGKAPECSGGPSPLRAALDASRWAAARLSVHGCPCSMWASLAPERTMAADRYPAADRTDTVL